MRRFLSGLITDTIRALTSKITFQVGGKDVIDVENDIVHFKYGGNTDNPVMIGTDLYDDVVTDNTIKVGQLNFPVYSSDTYRVDVFADIGRGIEWLRTLRARHSAR